MYALVDCNSFYASCEQVFRPDLRNKPIVVLSNNDGCIVSQSKEVKSLNIPPFVAYFKVKQQLDYNRVQAFSSNYELYADLSMRVMTTLETFCKDMSIYSIDEAFLDLSGDPHLVHTARAIKNTIAQHLGLPVCVGVAPTKTLAKLANHIAKKSNKCSGVCLIENISDWHNVFKKISVNKIWGIGRKISARLQLVGINNVYDFIHADAKYLRRLFSVNIERTWQELNGIRCIAFHDDVEKPKNIYRTRSFGNRVTDKFELQKSLSFHINNAAQKARQHDLLVASMLIFIQTSRYAKRPYQQQAFSALPTPTQDTRQLLSTATTLLEKIYKQDYLYAKAGVGLIELIDAKNYQSDLFSNPDSTKSKTLMKVIDSGTAQGFNIGFARNFIARDNWQMQRQYQSPKYTTNWNELPIIIV